jgi:hypothetical protein
MLGSLGKGAWVESDLCRTFVAALNHAAYQLAHRLDGLNVLETQARLRPALARIHDVHALPGKGRQSDRLAHDRAAA